MQFEENLQESMLSSEEIFDGIVLHVYRDTVNLPNNKPATREVIRHLGAVCVVPVTHDGNVILERQFRYPLNRVVTEIPAGKLDSPGEDFLAAAKRELAEETGIRADSWIDMGIYYPAAAYCDEKIKMYLAQDLHIGERKLDEDEFLDVFQYPMDLLVKDIMAGKIQDGKTQVAVLKAYNILHTISM